MKYAVSRDGTTLVTLHEGTDTTARDEAIGQLDASLESVGASGPITDWAISDADVYEHPTAPFEPYTITVTFTVSVAVEADDAAAAEELGASAIDRTLESAGVESVSYTSPPAASLS